MSPVTYILVVASGERTAGTFAFRCTQRVPGSLGGRPAQCAGNALMDRFLVTWHLIHKPGRRTPQDKVET